VIGISHIFPITEMALIGRRSIIHDHDAWLPLGTESAELVSGILPVLFARDRLCIRHMRTTIVPSVTNMHFGIRDLHR
jgi:hypothetical protein